MHRPRGRIALAVFFALLAAGAWMQVFSIVWSRSGPRSVAVFQALIGAAATATAIGSWSMAGWAPIAALLYGIVSASMLVALAPILGLEPSAARGIWLGAGVIAAFALWTAWYLRSLSQRGRAR